MAEATQQQATKKKITIGLIADIQYASNLSTSFISGQQRYYEHGPTKAFGAMRHWEALGAKVAVNLGDIIDRRAGDEHALESLETILDIMGGGGDPSPVTRAYHIHGNHDGSGCGFDAVHRALSPRLPTEEEAGGGFLLPNRADDPSALYFGFVHDGVAGLVLDTYDCAAKGADAKREAWAAVVRRGEDRLRATPHTQRHLLAYLRQHEEMNGAVGPLQLQWLARCLADCGAKGLPVVVFSHAPLVPQTAKFHDAVCLNCDEVLAVIHDAAGTSASAASPPGRVDVVACIAGHDHFGGFHIDAVGIPHVVVEASLCAPPHAGGHAVLDITFDAAARRVTEAAITGFGFVSSRVLRQTT